MADTIEVQVELAKLNTTCDNIEKLLQKLVKDNEKDHDKYEGKLETQGLDIAKMKTKQTTLAWIQVGISAAMSSISTYFGVR